jgi:type I restriction enzyme S subunit
LGDIAEINSRQINKDFSFKNIRYIDIASVTKGSIDNIQNLQTSKAPSRAKRLVKKNDILYSTVRPNLEHYTFIKNDLPNNTVASTGFAVITPNQDSVNPYYLYCLITQSQFTQYLSQVAEQAVSTYPTVSPNIIADLDLSIPPLSEQKRIANILSSFDNKIEQLKKENNILENIAQSIFKEWFVKYNFPNNDGKPYKDSGGKMIDSELGLIPDGWGVDLIGKYINIRGGGTPSTKEPEYWNGDINWTTPRDLANLDGLFLFDSGTKITPLGLKRISSGLLPIGTLLLSSRAPIGYLAFAQVETAINQGFIVFLPNSYLPNTYMYLWLKRNMKLIQSIANGSTFMEVNKENLKNFKIIIPAKDQLDIFSSKIEILFEKMSKNEYDIGKFKQVKTALLHKLFIGS